MEGARGPSRPRVPPPPLSSLLVGPPRGRVRTYPPPRTRTATCHLAHAGVHDHEHVSTPVRLRCMYVATTTRLP
eukprot:scaffold238672_cov33-Tisochrysis_lutea.AAC.1